MKSQIGTMLLYLQPMYDFLSDSDEDVHSLFKKAWKLCLCHCTDQASFKESSLCFSCFVSFTSRTTPSITSRTTPSIIVPLFLTLTLCFLRFQHANTPRCSYLCTLGCTYWNKMPYLLYVPYVPYVPYVRQRNHATSTQALIRSLTCHIFLTFNLPHPLLGRM